jgi:hypothetical protein
VIESFLNFGLLFLSLGGWGLFIFQKLKIHPAIIPIFLFSSITVVLFFAGLLNIMPLVVTLIYYIGLLLIPMYIYLYFKGKLELNIKELTSPSSFFFVISIIFLMILLKGVYYTHYDNFSHWALIVKEMYLMDGLPDWSTVISFKNYPPGTAIFIYFILKVTVYAESYALIAQGLLITASLTVLFLFTSWKKPSHIVLTLVAAISLITIGMTSLYNLIVDTTLGMVAFTSILIAFYYRDNWKLNLITNLPILLLLLLIKDSGKLFLVINALVIIGFISNQKLKNSFFKLKNLRFLSKIIAVLFFIPLTMNYLWVKYTEKAYHSDYENNKFAVTSSRIADTDKSEDFIDTLFPKMMDAFINIDAHIFINFLSISAAFIVGFIILLIVNKKPSKLLIYTALFYIGTLLIYIGSLYLMYLFLMPENEATRLASYYRYLSTIIIYISAVGMVSLLYEWNKLQFGPIAFVSTFFIAILFLYPMYQNIETVTQRPELNESIRLEVKPAVQKIHRIDKGDPRILFYSPESKNDRGYLQFVALYEHLSKNYQIVNSCETENATKSFISALAKSQYLAVLSNDNSQCMKSVISSDVTHGVYKIIKTEDKVTVKKIE